MLKEFLTVGRSDYINQTYKWISSDTEEEYIRAIKDKDIPYGPNDVEYNYNNFGFRCDNFESWNHHPYRILYAGCSMTEGIGLPLQDVWAKQMHQMICQNLNCNIPYWNIATAGSGIDQMIRYLYNLKDIIKPQIIISYLPNTVRRERWTDDAWSSWDVETSFWTWPIKIEREKEVFLNQRFINYQTEKNLAMLDMILNEIDCNFLYSSSMPDFKISNYIQSNRYIQRDHLPEQYDYARDGIHAGPKTNSIMAREAFEYFWPYIKQRLTI